MGSSKSKNSTITTDNYEHALNLIQRQNDRLSSYLTIQMTSILTILELKNTIIEKDKFIEEQSKLIADQSKIITELNANNIELSKIVTDFQNKKLTEKSS